MELDAKHTVLFAVYSEYQKDIPDMGALTPDLLKLDRRVFNVALMKLENEGLVVTKITPLPTRYGLDYVEKKLGIGHMDTGKEKIEMVIDRCVRFGWDSLRNVLICRCQG